LFGRCAVERSKVLFFAAVVLILAVLACGKGGNSYSFSTTRTGSGNSGRIEIKGDASGAVTDEFEVAENFPGATVDLEVAASVKEGSYTVEFLDADGSVVLSLDVKPGEPSRGGGAVTLNDAGEVEYTITAGEAEGILLAITYEIR
jgi:hypothetical protein